LVSRCSQSIGRIPSALIAPHVFPNHVGTVNAFTRHNVIPDTESTADDQENDESSTGNSDTTVTSDSPKDSGITDEKLEVAVRRDKKYKRTFTVLAFVVPNLRHPLLLNLPDKNSSELMTKCFVEHGYNVRETRNTMGLAINRYIIDVLLKDYENLDELIEKERLRKETESYFAKGISKKDRRQVFFKF
jgi:hypothetical protein